MLSAPLETALWLISAFRGKKSDAGNQQKQAHTNKAATPQGSHSGWPGRRSRQGLYASVHALSSEVDTNRTSMKTNLCPPERLVTSASSRQRCEHGSVAAAGQFFHFDKVQVLNMGWKTSQVNPDGRDCIHDQHFRGLFLRLST